MQDDKGLRSFKNKGMGHLRIKKNNIKTTTKTRSDEVLVEGRGNTERIAEESSNNY